MLHTTKKAKNNNQEIEREPQPKKKNTCKNQKQQEI